MRNLWIFISRYNAFFFFIIFFAVGIILTLKNNVFQRSVTLNSTNEVVGSAYERLNVLKRYLNLGQVNDSLATENAKLKTELISLKNIDSSKTIIVKDTVNQQQYTLLSAKVIKNSVTQRNNIITINRGSDDGIVKDMAVISPNKGVVGFILNVSPHLATIRSLLHKETLISVNLKKNNAFGSLVWGDGNFDFRKAYVKEIPNHFKVNVGDTIVTSGAGGFPKGIEVGKISKTKISTGDSFMTLEINLFNDFSTLQYVYIIKNRLAEEQKVLEIQTPNEQ
ncbi:rod shape-determining protein MreC [Pedobacter sp. LMG 31464]|uniref:Cell shape-determining protein MreC n=1 Tax=Pedobacter planticolens TaxID=2679964 RepID=A0A923IVK5_9SPHI|nr:rod shape-determining protein MreC [Pedobacter planticolens]MBB2147120.1 rod shape-determining protein MreC [Pedobacter planticolens]